VRKRSIGTGMLVALIVLTIFFLRGIAIAGGYYHIVQEGDTLWDICEKYYGNPWLWPKLWEMNPFVTNPHLLKPGDKINLLEDVPLKRPAAKEEEKQVASSSAQMESGKWWEKGLEVSGLTQVRSIGYFSREPLDPIGAIVSSDTERLILAERDKIVVRIDNQEMRPGDIIWVYRNSEEVRYPTTNSPSGFVISILGNIKITKALKQGLYNAVVNETFKDIRVGDVLTRYNPVSSCVVPTAPPGSVKTEILATKDLVQIIGQFAVVYLDGGKDQGINRGNLFEVIKERPGLPDLIIGYVLILDSQPDTATGVVVEAKEHFYSGAKLRAIGWEDAPRYLAAIPPCS